MKRRYIEKKKDFFYKKAKHEGYRTRSAYKLIQIQKKFSIINKGDIVIDLGAAPGGWSQAAKKLVGKNGKVIGIDILPIIPINGIIFLKEDITKKDIVDKIQTILGKTKANVVLSDMSPKISGSYSTDHARSIHLCEHALSIADTILCDGGKFICKIFDGEYLISFLKIVTQKFQKVKRFSPPASRKSSSELYIIGKTYKSNKNLVHIN